MNISQTFSLRGVIAKVFDAVETSSGDPRVDFVVSQMDRNWKGGENYAFFSSFSGTALFVKKLQEGQAVEVLFDLRSFQNKIHADKFFTNLTCRRVKILSESDLKI